MIDTNTYLSRWPFRRLVGDETPDFVARLRKRNVTQAWAGSFDGILHKDIAGVNARLAADCRAHGSGFLVPFGSVNPVLSGWQDDLRRCRVEHRMPGIRLHPNYHGYKLADPEFAELLHLATEQRLIVQLAVCMEDVRTQSPLMRVPPVDLSALPGVLQREPGSSLVLLNWKPAIEEPEQLKPLAAAGSVHFDISMVEGIEGVARLVERLPTERILFGSNYPLFYFESALFKMQESGLNAIQKQALFEGNARRLLASSLR
jgi:predicted TIM-barrel fold metal-dependent hydrolase